MTAATVQTTKVMQALQEAVEELHEAQKLIAGLQEICGPVNGLGDETPNITTRALWNRLETIDDRIFDALSRMGE